MQLETQRLILREFTPDDVPAVLAYQQTPEYRSLRSTDDYTLEDAEAFVARFVGWQLERPRQRFQLAMTLKSRPDLIGTCGIRMQTGAQRIATIGYELDPEYWGSGYATESARRMIEFGFQDLGLERIEAWCRVDNAASIRVLEKLRLCCEGRSADSEPSDGANTSASPCSKLSGRSLRLSARPLHTPEST